MSAEVSASARTPLLIPISDPSAVTEAAAALRSGSVVAIPTDTVYGLAAVLSQPRAIGRLFALKGRSPDKAIPILLGDPADLSIVASGVSRSAQTLVDRFWPGALTIVLPARHGLPAGVTAKIGNGTRTVAVRVPDHDLVRRLIRLSGGALAVTSANHSGESPALDARSVLGLGHSAPDMVLDGGRSELCMPSTIVLVGVARLKILREGAIPAALIAAAIEDDVGGGAAFGLNRPHTV